MSLLSSIRNWLGGSDPFDDELGNLTPRAQQVLALARKEADRFNHNFVGTEHLLLGLIKLGQGVAVNVLQKMGLDLETVRQEVEKLSNAGPDMKQVGNIPYTPRVKKVLSLASKEAKALNHTYVGTEHILLGLLDEGDGVAAKVLKRLGIDIKQVRQEILSELDPNFQAFSSTDVSAPLKRWSSTGGSTGSDTPDFTPRAQELLGLARKEADRLRHHCIGSEHLLLGLVNLGRGVAANVLDKRGIKLEALRAEVEKFSLPDESQTPGGTIPYTPVAIRALSQAQKEAKALNHTYVGTEHILLGLLHEETSIAAKLLADLGVEVGEVRKAILKELDPDANP
jgi:ATP-dependent Clp protease ATP-binding subunit ClpA